MLTIYLVDDEIMSIEYFKILFSQCNCTDRASIIGAHTNAITALDEILRLKPQVLFIDVLMPGMNGLELSKRILAEHPSAKIILLTAHKDFDFIQVGLQIGIFDYLIKHEISPEHVSDVIQRIQMINTREQDVATLELREGLRSLLQSSDAVSLQPSARLRTLLACCTLVDIRAFRPITLSQFTHYNQNPPYVLIADPLLLPDLEPAIIIPNGHNQWLCLLPFFQQVSQMKIQQETTTYVHQIQAFFEKHGVEVCCVTSLPCYGVDSVINTQQQMNAHSSRIFLFNQRVMTLCQLIPTVQPPQEEAFEGFWNLLKKRQYPQASTLLKEVLHAAHQGATFEGFIAIIRRLSSILWNFLKAEHLHSDKQPDKGVFDSAQAACNYLEDLLAMFTPQADNVKSFGLSRCLHYVQQHYANPDLSVASLAQQCHMSERHVRQLFRQELQTSPLAHIVDYRINKAIQMMAEPGLHLPHLYKKVGFSSSSYFINVFKKKMGMTPMQYYRRL